MLKVSFSVTISCVQMFFFCGCEIFSSIQFRVFFFFANGYVTIIFITCTMYLKIFFHETLDFTFIILCSNIWCSNYSVISFHYNWVYLSIHLYMVAEMLQKTKFLLYVLYLCYIKFYSNYIFHIYVICFIV